MTSCNRSAGLVRTRLVAGWLAVGLWTPLAAGPGGGPAQLFDLEPAQELLLPRELVLEAIHPQELGLAVAEQALALDPLIPVGSAPTTVTRVVSSFWRLRLPAGGPAPTLQVSYDVWSLDGVRGQLSLPGQAEATLSIRVEPDGVPRITGRGPGMTQIRGGATFRLALDNVRHSGNYGGTLLVTIHQL